MNIWLSLPKDKETLLQKATLILEEEGGGKGGGAEERWRGRGLRRSAHYSIERLLFHTFLCADRNTLEVLEKPSCNHGYCPGWGRV